MAGGLAMGMPLGPQAVAGERRLGDTGETRETRDTRPENNREEKQTDLEIFFGEDSGDGLVAREVIVTEVVTEVLTEDVT